MPEEISSAVVWLTGLVLGAAETLPVRLMVTKGTITSPRGQRYNIFGTEGGKPLASTEVFRLYAAQLPSGQLGLMKIASNPAFNSILQYEAEVLGRLERIAADIDAEDRTYNYGAFFPTVVESIAAGDGRSLMFLGFHPSITDYQQLQPLPQVLNGVRVDLQTIVWILGKSLKVLDFTHRLAGTSVGFVDASNLLLETKQHGVLFFDWSRAQESPADIVYKSEVAALAKIAWQAAGGNDLTIPPHDPHLMDASQFNEFVAFLGQLMTGETNAGQAHKAIYDLANRIWSKEEKIDKSGTVTKRPFHEFRTYALE